MSQSLPIEWPSDGLIPAVIQDATSHDVLMVGFMNREALQRTRESGFVHFWSRSRQKLWKKGETSGHVQHVRDIYLNCELNSLLIEVEQVGAVCHDGYPTCYYRRLTPENGLETIRDRWFDPSDVYGDKEGLESTTRRWWGAYEYLRDTDLMDVSGTSRRLRDAQTSLTPRIADELRELAGVLDGSHVHAGQAEDILLESSQVLYWIVGELVRTGVTFDAVRPDRALDVSAEASSNPETISKIVRRQAEGVPAERLTAEMGHALFALVANAAASLGVAPLDLIRKDLTDLATRDYLAPYFSR